MKPIVVISAINIFNAGPLSVAIDCLKELSKISNYYHIIAFVYKSKLYDGIPDIELIELPNARRSYLFKLYYEYIYFKKISKKLSPYLWLSLNDVSPNVTSTIRGVYCHNVTAFYRFSLNDFVYQPQLLLFSLFYKFIYRINIRKNDFVVVQQAWIRELFVKEFNLEFKKIVVAHPNIPEQVSHFNFVSENTTFYILLFLDHLKILKLYVKLLIY